MKAVQPRSEVDSIDEHKDKVEAVNQTTAENWINQFAAFLTVLSQTLQSVFADSR
jgi:hypothetical protein